MGLDNPLHIAFLVVILLLVFGAKRLPEIGRSLGSGMREFKQSITGETPQQPALGAPPQQPALETTSQPAAQPAPAQAAPDQAAMAQPAQEQQAPAEQKS
jgi:sec-independent protein translocase protein TatA